MPVGLRRGRDRERQRRADEASERERGSMGVVAGRVEGGAGGVPAGLRWLVTGEPGTASRLAASTETPNPVITPRSSKGRRGLVRKSQQGSGQSGAHLSRAGKLGGISYEEEEELRRRLPRSPLETRLPPRYCNPPPRAGARGKTPAALPQSQPLSLSLLFSDPLTPCAVELPTSPPYLRALGNTKGAPSLPLSLW